MFLMTKKIIKKATKQLYLYALDAKYGEDREVMIVILDFVDNKLKAEEDNRDFALRFKLDFKPKKDCIKTLRTELGYRSMMLNKSKPRLIILSPTIKALKALGIKEAYKLLFGCSWKGKSIDPMEKLIAEYKVFA